MATMRLRCIHSCMVLTVVGLLLVYSAFLTSPSYVDSTLDGGETTGSFAAINNTLIQNKLLANAISDVAALSLTDAIELRFSQLQNASGAFGSGEASKSIGNSHNLIVSSQDALLSLPTVIQNEIPVSSPKKKDTPPLESKQQQQKPSKNAVRTKDIYEAGFSYPNPEVCPNEGLDVKLVILITSAPGHFSARDAIRLTWGHYSQRLDVSIAFIIGSTDNETILEGIETEKHLYDDLIVANFQDSYDNLTLKTMSSLEWMDAYCNQSEYILKTDDDMFINVPNLLSFIDKISKEDKKTPKLYGRLARKWKPVRNKKSKYFISFQQYRKTAYPDFTTGPAYLFSTRLVRPLFEKGMEKTYLKLEDVYTTGIVAQELKIKRMNIAEFANKKVNFRKTGFCALSRLISMHMVAYHEQFELWKKILDGRTKCKIIYTNATKSAANKSQTNATNNSSTSGGSNVGGVTITNSSSSSLSSVSSSSSVSGGPTTKEGGSGALMVSSPAASATLNTSEQLKK